MKKHCIKQFNHEENILKALLPFMACLTLMGCGVAPQEVVDNYRKHEDEILAIEEFLRARKPLYVEFNHPESIDIILRRRLSNGLSQVYFSKWGTSLQDPEVISALEEIGWSMSDINQLYRLLRSANCISIGYVRLPETGIENILELGYKRSWPVKYVYLIFPEQLSKEEMERRTEGITDKIHRLSDRIAWCALRGGFG